MKRNIKIGYLTAYDPKDKRSWSGIHYRMYTALEKEFPGIVLLGPIKKNNLLEKTLYFISVFHLKMFYRRYNKLHNVLRSKFYAKEIQKKLKKENLDILFAPAAATEIAFLKTNIPICYLSDTSFGQLSQYYESFALFSALSQRESNIVERRALKKSAHLIYSSSWAAKYVIEHYSADKEKISIIPFGANLDFSLDKELAEKTFDNTLHILFAAKHWSRKGGDIVLKTFQILEKKNGNVKLTILGCEPPIEISNSRIQVIPFLNKNLPEEEERFLNIFKDAHLFFLPTRADCTPIVICEANAFGIPVITTATGGVTSLVKDGENGYALSIDAGPEEYAAIIQELLDEPKKLKEMSEKARGKFEKELNWDNWAAEMKGIFLEMVKLNP